MKAPLSLRRLCFVILVLMLLLATAPVYSQDASETDTYRALKEALIPPRDRLDLARRLLGVTELPPIPTAPPVYTEGMITTFTAVNLGNARRFNFEARLVYLSDGIAVWFERGFTPDLDAVSQSMRRFEQVIVPTVRDHFGHEDTPGIDADPRLHIVHASDLGSGVAAYFDPDSEFARALVPYSNERQMFLVNLDGMSALIGTPFYEGVLAHEFQHMIHAHNDVNESVWLDEGMAELASAVAGYSSPQEGAWAFARSPGTQLNHWSVLEESAPHYGASFQFAAYFWTRFGKAGIRALVENPRDDWAGIAHSLATLQAIDPAVGTPYTLESFFAEWTAANIILAPEGAPYSYAALPFALKRPFMALAQVGKPQNLTLTPWGTVYLKVAHPGRYRLSFTGEALTRLLPLEESTNTFWWSNRGDEIESRLTRRLDLRKVSSATLTYRLWYDLETDWDFGFVQVSTNDGLTWTPLPATRTNPPSDNNPFGQAYTGQGDWATERIDLTPYAGSEVLIRFAYLTDAALNLNGMALDDLAVPEIGYYDDAESNAQGWTAEGWARIRNVLPGRYLVQAVKLGASPSVILFTIGGTETIGEFEVNSATPEVILVFAGLTEFTTETMNSQYVLERLD